MVAFNKELERNVKARERYSNVVGKFNDANINLIGLPKMEDIAFKNLIYLARSYLDDITYNHSMRVGRLAELIGNLVGYDGPSLKQMGFFHDLGKCMKMDLKTLIIPNYTAEFTLERSIENTLHTIKGAGFLQEYMVENGTHPLVLFAMYGCLLHHENWEIDTGYLLGTPISTFEDKVLPRLFDEYPNVEGFTIDNLRKAIGIIKLADMVDALTDPNRPYKNTANLSLHEYYTEQKVILKDILQKGDHDMKIVSNYLPIAAVGALLANYIHIIGEENQGLQFMLLQYNHGPAIHDLATSHQVLLSQAD